VGRNERREIGDEQHNKHNGKPQRESWVFDAKPQHFFYSGKNPVA
jgi:hypothetical protein